MRRNELGTSRREDTGWLQVDGKKRTGYISVGRHGLGTSRWGKNRSLDEIKLGGKEKVPGN